MHVRRLNISQEWKKKIGKIEPDHDKLENLGECYHNENVPCIGYPAWQIMVPITASCKTQ